MVSEEKLKKLRNYLVQATKWIESVDGKNYRVPATLQIFVDKQNIPKYIREV